MKGKKKRAAPHVSLQENLIIHTKVCMSKTILLGFSLKDLCAKFFASHDESYWCDNMHCHIYY